MVLTRLEKKNSDLAEVEVDEVLGLMSHVAAKVPSHDAVPSGIVFLVKFLQKRELEIHSNVLLDVVLFQGLSSTLHRVLLHLFRHVCILDHCLSITHDCLYGAKNKSIQSCRSSCLPGSPAEQPHR
uniref:Dynein light chain n=1 Tax=Strix occidentalis caurina TaxID=311401 RepID=A0A8D0EGX0_STROC